MLHCTKAEGYPVRNEVEVLKTKCDMRHVICDMWYVTLTFGVDFGIMTKPPQLYEFFQALIDFEIRSKEILMEHWRLKVHHNSGLFLNVTYHISHVTVTYHKLLDTSRFIFILGYSSALMLSQTCQVSSCFHRTCKNHSWSSTMWVG